VSLDQNDASSTVIAQLFSAEQTWHHIRVECTGVVDDIVETLSPEGPYAYTVNPVPTFDGSVPNQEIAYTREGIRKAYADLHEISMVTGLRATTEIRSDWYTFVCGIGDGQELATGQMHHTPVAIIFPNHGGVGISGELIWRPSQLARLGDGSDAPLAGAIEIYNLHEGLLGYLHRGDIEAIVGMSAPDVQTAVRDYVADDGTVNNLHSSDELRGYLERFYDRFAVRRLEFLHRHIESWLVFAELLWEVEFLTGPQIGTTTTFRTAEMAEFNTDRRITARIGHGTAMSPRP
jgi:hypothetical protein